MQEFKDPVVENIRDSLRYDTFSHRQDIRESLWGRNRIISDAVRKEIQTSEDVKILCEKLKCKSKITREDLSALKQALFYDDRNIAVFFSIEGTLHALIRELSGHKAMHQLEAACCCCNLALGDPKFTLRLTKAATPYLAAHLDGLSTVTVDVCVWAVGNLASGGDACWQILHDQGVLDKLLRLLHTSDEMLTSTLVYALTHYVSAGLDAMPPEVLAKVATETHQLLELQPASYWLLFLLSFPSASSGILVGNHLVSRCCQLLVDLAASGSSVDQQLSRVTALLRIVGNLVAGADGTGAMELLSSQATSAFKSLLAVSCPHVRKECVWLLANVWCHPNEAVRQVCSMRGFVDQELQEQLNTCGEIIQCS
ncbi:uncharacterized protein LOC134541665 [Bacillus rossius redtenbacheri]|uniref:uncharacterized protein LOC134541665 n=1 Tax=Bacillus rossius redtenbacheri TaxID=93214 RepID=UPI002FDD1524